MINKDKIKGFLAGVSMAVVLCSTTVFADSISKTVTAVYNNIKIMIDGEEITPKDVNGNVVEPFIIDGTTYLPVRAIASALDQEVNWDGETNTVYIGEMPSKNTAFEVNSDSMKPFAEAQLLSVGSAPVNGGIFNFYITQNASDEYMRYASDNYSPDATLQTLTIDSVPAAKFHAEQAAENIKLIFAAYNEAEKVGFANKQENINEVNAQWDIYRSQFGDEAAFSAFTEQNSITVKDLELLAKKSFMTTLYMDSIYETKLKDNYDTTAYEAKYHQDYITAKHILVEDEALAKEIITKLNKGQNFDTLMNEHNTDPGATEAGYTFTYGQMVEPFEAAAYALKEKTYTKEAVKSDYGYHIIYRCPLNEDEVTKAITAYKETLASQATNDYIAALTEKTAVTYTADYEKYITTIE